MKERNQKLMFKRKDFQLPVHSLETDSKHINILPLDHNNPYDHKREHRHTYFELMFIEGGGGNQLIDFKKYALRDHSCYMIFPHQIHLMNRNNSSGMIVQFTEERISSPDILAALKRISFDGNATVIFENHEDSINDLNVLLNLLGKSILLENTKSEQTVTYLLQALVSLALEKCNQNENSVFGEGKKLWLYFIQMIEDNYCENWGVQDYIHKLSSNERKLSAATRKFAGLSPLQVIHNRILLEAKRLLLFEETSHKEIAFKLGFDSPSSFSSFIKTKTGYTPSKLSVHLKEFISN